MKKLLPIALLATLASLSHAETYALIVGINDYPDPVDSAGSPLKDEKGQPVTAKLRGCVNDAQNVRTILTGKYNVKAENIITLTDGDAVKDKFLAGFKSQLGKLAPGDQFLFFYSGHGTRVDAPELKEADGKGSAIVLRDYCLVRGNVFGSLAKSLSESGVKSTFVFDSCFAGGMSRDTNIFGIEGSRKKTLDAGSMGRKAAVLPDARLLSLAKMKSKSIEAASYAFIYASQKDVTSIDFPGNPEKGVKPQGLFTFALLSVLTDEPSLPIGDVVDAIAAMFEKVFAGKDIKQRPEDEFSSADRAKLPLVLGG